MGQWLSTRSAELRGAGRLKKCEGREGHTLSSARGRLRRVERPSNWRTKNVEGATRGAQPAVTLRAARDRMSGCRSRAWGPLAEAAGLAVGGHATVRDARQLGRGADMSERSLGHRAGIVSSTCAWGARGGGGGRAGSLKIGALRPPPGWPSRRRVGGGGGSLWGAQAQPHLLRHRLRALLLRREFSPRGGLEATCVPIFAVPLL